MAHPASVPVGPVTKMIGAIQGWGRLIRVRITESPCASAVKLPVLTLVTVAVFPVPMVWQLTRARKSVNGLVPCRAGGTGDCFASTSPRTSTNSRPSLLSSPEPDLSIHGRPPPTTPRIGLVAPTYGPVTGVIVSNLSTRAEP